MPIIKLSIMFGQHLNLLAHHVKMDPVVSLSW